MTTPRASFPSRAEIAVKRVSTWYRRYKTRRRACDPVLRVLSVCLVVLFANLLYAAILFVPQQSAEALRVLSEDNRSGLYRMFLMWALSVLLGVLLWWSARLTLSNLHPRARWWPGLAGFVARNLPRLMGATPVILLGIALAMVRAGGESNTRAADLTFAGLMVVPVLAWLVIRRWNKSQQAFRIVALVGMVMVGTLAVVQTSRTQSGLSAVVGLCAFSAPAFFVWAVRRTRDRKHGDPDPPLAWGYLVVGTLAPIAISIAAFIVFTLAPTLPSYLGAESIVLIAALTWLPLLAVLHWGSFKLRAPLILALMALSFTLSWLDINDNHAVRCWAGTARPAAPLDFRISFTEWLKARPKPPGDKPVPVILVAAEGGGIYAAYHTARALCLLQEMNPEFADQVFAVSGVSGGSVGASVFCALVQHAKEHPEVVKGRWYTETADKVLSNDLLSPLLATALLEDMLQQFFAPPLARWDRARSLEGALERSWRSAIGSDTFEEPFDHLWTKYPHSAPSLVLNTTEVESGQRVVVSNLLFRSDQPPFLASLRSLDSKLVPCLSTAACLSARFPVVTPAAWVEAASDAPRPGKHRLVDGGYFENTGIATAMEMFHAARRILTADPSLPRCRFILIRIGAEEGKSGPPAEGLGEILSPFRTMLHTREARGLDAIRQLQYTTVEFDPNRDSGPKDRPDRPERIEFVLKLDRGYPIPLGWLLSEEARDEIASQLPSVDDLWPDKPAHEVTAANPPNPRAQVGPGGLPAVNTLRPRRPPLASNSAAAIGVRRLLKKSE